MFRVMAYASKSVQFCRDLYRDRSISFLHFIYFENNLNTTAAISVIVDSGKQEMMFNKLRQFLIIALRILTAHNFARN